jgi:hypothetical protein
VQRGDLTDVQLERLDVLVQIALRSDERIIELYRRIFATTGKWSDAIVEKRLRTTVTDVNSMSPSK